MMTDDRYVEMAQQLILQLLVCRINGRVLRVGKTA